MTADAFMSSAGSGSGEMGRADWVDPKSLDLVTYPEAVLRRKALPLKSVTEHVRAVAARMFEVMREHKGIGLAAPQVGLSWRMFVLEVPRPEDDDDDRTGEHAAIDASARGWSEGPMVFINPVVSMPRGGVEPWSEGCLSLPNVHGDVLRPPVVKVTALDEQGREFSMQASGLLARCVQHELDHLDGVLILDRMTQMARLKNRSAVRDLEGR
jgi:peptide deformylase